MEFIPDKDIEEDGSDANVEEGLGLFPFSDV